MDMIIIEFFHTLLTIFNYFYGYFTKKNSFDFFYLFYGYFVDLSWSFYKGHCPISYYYKKIKNSSDETTDADDFNLIFGKKYEPFMKKYHRLIFNVGMMIYLVSFYLVMVRQKFPMIPIFILLFIHASYYITIINDMHYHSLFRVLLIGCLLYILSRWK